MIKGIDVSQHRGEIDWEKAKSDGVEFAIIRCGLGDDIKSQDDTQFERNWAECERLNIPHTVYLFSYGVTKEHIDSEVAHIKRLLNGKTVNAPVYIDIENTNGLNWRALADDEMLTLMQYYYARLAELGYKMGIYSSRSAFWNEKMTDDWYENVSKWVAEYGDKVNGFGRPYDMWQYSSSGNIEGISGRTDMNFMLNDIFFAQPSAPDFPDKINIYYKVRTAGRWLPEVKNLDDYAGIQGKPVTDVMIKVDKGSVKYRVHVKSGEWLPYVKGYDQNNDKYGYAGNGRPIDAVEIYYFTPDGVKPYRFAKYRVSAVNGKYYPWQSDNSKENGMDGYAGVIGVEIDKLQIKIE